MFSKMLLCYDGSREGRAALKQGAELAAVFHAEVHLLAVIRTSAASVIGESMSTDAPFHDQHHHIETILNEGVERLRARGIIAHGHVAIGEPVEEIAAVAHTLGVNLIVLGHRTRSAFARWWSGSVGVSLLDTATCSILVCLAAPDEPPA